MENNSPYCPFADREPYHNILSKDDLDEFLSSRNNNNRIWERMMRKYSLRWAVLRYIKNTFIFHI